MKIKKLFAFTLAETLIVMGIIGVVAALTIPNLNSSTNDKEKVAKVKKIYSNLQDAYGRAEASYGPVDEWFISDGTDKGTLAKRAGERMTDFMKISKVCGVASGSNCFKNSASIGVNKSSSTVGNLDTNTSIYKVLLADGGSAAFSVLNSSCANNTFSNGNATTEAYYTCGEVYVDIDGPSKGKNMFGSDLFWFLLTKNGVYPMGSENDKYGNSTTALSSNCFQSGLACAAWVIQNDNMDYIKSANGVCPNSGTLAWNHTSCK